MITENTFCIYCDKPDPTMNPYYSLMAWIAKHHTYTDEKRRIRLGTSQRQRNI